MGIARSLRTLMGSNQRSVQSFQCYMVSEIFANTDGI